MISAILFWSALFLIVYTYFLYPVFLFFTAKITPPVSNSQAGREQDLPFVSVIIAARNEEQNIYKRLANLTEQSYPSQRYEIVVVSDGSDDGTQSEVERFVSEQNHVNPRLNNTERDLRMAKVKHNDSGCLRQPRYVRAFC